MAIVNPERTSRKAVDEIDRDGRIQRIYARNVLRIEKRLERLNYYLT